MAYTISIPSSGHQFKVYDKTLGRYTTNTTIKSGISYGASDSKPDRSRSRKPTGWLYPKAYSRAIESFGPTFGSTTIDSKSLSEERSGDLSGIASVGVPSRSFDPSLSTRAEMVALTRLKSQKVNLGIALAEMQATADTVGNAARGAAALTKAACKGQSFNEWARKLSTLRRKWKRIPSEWLQYCYGVRPLMMDVYGAVSELEHTLDEHRPSVSVKGSSRENIKDVSYRPSPTTPMRREDTGFAGCFVRLDYESTSEALQTAGRLGLTNPAEVIYETIPYSFVLDWFIPIGPWLSTMDADIGLEFKSGSKSEIVKLTRVCKFDARVWQKPTNALFISGSFAGRSKRLSLVRTPYLATPFPRMPSIRNPLSLGHMANGLALLTQAFR